MKCVRCGTENIRSASYCMECDAPLRFRRRSERYHARKILITSAIVIVWASVFMFFFRESIFTDDGGSGQDLSSYATKRSAAADAARAKLQEELKKAYKLQQAALKEEAASEELIEEKDDAAQPTLKSEAGKEIVSGVLTIKDPWNREMAALQAVVLKDGWVALPARTCIGGTRWAVNTNAGNAEIKSGIWQRDLAIGLWQVVPSLAKENSVGLKPWNSDAPVRWLSIQSEMEMDDIALSTVRNEGDYVYATFPDANNEVGILVQGEGVVGWTFGQWLSGAYLWSPNSEVLIESQSTISVDSFYDITFAGGREEKFNIALAMGENEPVENVLAQIIEGFRLPPKLAAQDTPYYLLPEEMIKNIRPLVKQAIADGKAKFVIDNFDQDVLVEIGDINLFMDIGRSISSVYGYETAVNAIENTGKAIVQNLGFDVPSLNELHLNVYQEWLQSLVTNGDVEEAGRVYTQIRNYYSNDPYIHLLAVEIELLLGNWADAEIMLYQRNYPPELLDRFELLARRISDMKGQENTIVVRFEPGSNRIPLTATLNGVAPQNFLVDTGASMVTIPVEMVDELGLEIIEGDHYGERTVSTAGGLRSASEVIIDSIEIDGWVEYEVRALVMDIPAQEGLGLLGLNYLGRFRMDLNSEDGVLGLTPK